MECSTTPSSDFRRVIAMESDGAAEQRGRPRDVVQTLSFHGPSTGHFMIDRLGTAGR
jgi:hypothetical protein